MEKFTAKSIVSMIDTNKQKYEEIINRKYYSRIIAELEKEGFTSLSNKVKYILKEQFYPDIYTSGNILEYNGIIIAVCDSGIYVSPLMDIHDNMELDFCWLVSFGPNIYKNLYEIINNLFNNTIEEEVK